MDKFTKAFVAAAAFTTITLGAVGSAHADDSKTTTSGSPCSYAGYKFPNGSKVTKGDGTSMLCVDGDWVSIGGKPVAPTSVVGSLLSIFKR